MYMYNVCIISKLPKISKLLVRIRLDGRADVNEHINAITQVTMSTTVPNDNRTCNLLKNNL